MPVPAGDPAADSRTGYAETAVCIHRSPQQQTGCVTATCCISCRLWHECVRLEKRERDDRAQLQCGAGGPRPDSQTLHASL